MKRNKITFLIAEIGLALLLLLLVNFMFADEKPQKRVAVIVENSGDEKWDSFINGLKHAADQQNIHLIICNTDEIENAEEERRFLEEQMENEVDAFLVQAAPGYDTAQMLQEMNSQRPVLLVVNDVLQKDENAEEESDALPAVIPDNYAMGYELGREIIRQNGEKLDGKTIGIINGLRETDSALKRSQGLKDALSGTGCRLAYDISISYDMAITDVMQKQVKTDFVAVLETKTLEQIAALCQEEAWTDVGLYGIGNSIKCVYYLDSTVIDGMVLVDAYDMGYQSVMEIARMLRKKLYNGSDRTIDCQVLKRADIFTEETQKLLRTYN